jgi:folate-binding protein YgfZ
VSGATAAPGGPRAAGGAVPPEVALGYARLAPHGGGAAVLGACALVWVEGPDAERFLQGLLTQDVAGVPVGGACYALLLDAKGRIQLDARVARDGEDSFTLVARPESGAVLAETLERYHVSEDLDVLGPEPSGLLTVAGVPAAPSAGPAELIVPGLVPGTWDLVVADPEEARAALGLPEAPPAALEVLRIEAGVPLVGVDTGPATLVQEAGLEGAAVSFEKGCYLGQETVARVAYRGHVNRRLRGLVLGSPATPGAAVRAEGREVGRVTSAAVSPARGPIALALLRTSVGPGDRVAVDGVPEPAPVVALPFS